MLCSLSHHGTKTLTLNISFCCVRTLLDAIFAEWQSVFDGVICVIDRPLCDTGDSYYIQ